MQVAIAHEKLEKLNEKYRPLSIKERIRRLYEDFPQDQVMLTSSFATTSAFLLSLFSEVHPSQKVYFIDTGYHFPETLQYKAYLTKLYKLHVESIGAAPEDHEFTSKNETWKDNAEYCCHINKVHPLDQIKQQYTVWVSGLMKWQSDHRSSLDIFEERKGIVKFYPLIDVSREERARYFREKKLPLHPLIFEGYSSIGCSHCTVPGEDRNGRWNNSPKTECGLHL